MGWLPVFKHYETLIALVNFEISKTLILLSLITLFFLMTRGVYYVLY